MTKEFDATEIAEARAFYAEQKGSVLMRLTMRGNFVFAPASEAMGHHSTTPMPRDFGGR